MSNFLKKYRLAILLLAFLTCTSLAALNYIFHYPDEKHYTDASIIMQENHDYFTPYNYEGSPRFLKPIATYWFTVGSYALFGASPFSSRFFFWLSGGFLVLIVYYMARSLTGNKKTAWLAALIVATNPLLIISATRSIPDILLALFLTISAWGFLEIMAKPEKKKKIYYWMAFMGAALAFETKGLPAAAFTGASLLFLLINPWRRIKAKDLFEPVSLLISILVSCSWFVIMYIKFGDYSLLHRIIF